MGDKYIVPIISLTEFFFWGDVPGEGLHHRDLSSVGLRFCFFGFQPKEPKSNLQFSTEGTEVKSASVTQTEVEI